MHGLSLVAASRGYSLVAVSTWGSHCLGFFCCREQSLECGLSSCGTGLRCHVACGIFPHPGRNAGPPTGRQIFNCWTSGEVLGHLFSCASCAFSLFNIFALSSSFVFNQLFQIFLFLSFFYLSFHSFSKKVPEG